MTGRSGAGKSTLVNAVAQRLQVEGLRVQILDGDVVRREVTSHLGFTPADIRENNRIIAELCARDRTQYDIIFVPVISPFEDARQLVREKLGDGFHLVYVKASLARAAERDVKGWYRKALQGEIEYFIGVDQRVPFEEPPSPDLLIESDRETADASAARLYHFVQSVARTAHAS